MHLVAHGRSRHGPQTYARSFARRRNPACRPSSSPQPNSSPLLLRLLATIAAKPSSSPTHAAKVSSTVPLA
ncbi:hypothetical protein NL676_015808 [Syzygium grande]|nr:hypothetical protein NL676_015808 [Syzygium grande]